MKYIGFSTGAIAFSDFNKALEILQNTSANAVELSALRMHELDPLVSAAKNLYLSKYSYISVHAPSKFNNKEEPHVVKQLEILASNGWPIVLHPDTIHDYSLWKIFGNLLLIENMDNRKSYGRTCLELDVIFDKLPNARFCFDIAHARQYDKTMNEAYNILKNYSNIITQVHISEVDDNCVHKSISKEAINDYKKVSRFIPKDVSVIIETITESNNLEEEIKSAKLSIS